MATRSEIALAYRLGLRLRLFDTEVVERWLYALLKNAETVEYPLTDLVVAQPRAVFEDLLKHFPDPADPLAPTRVILAWVGKRVREGQLHVREAIALGMKIGAAGNISEDEYFRIDALDDGWALATSDVYGNQKDVEREIRALFSEYARYEESFFP